LYDYSKEAKDKLKGKFIKDPEVVEIESDYMDNRELTPDVKEAEAVGEPDKQEVSEPVPVV